jgi:phosphate transport system substrate-binding protein
MAERIGICTNIGNCKKADSGERLTIPAGALFVCPECSKELSEVRGKGGNRAPALILVGALALLAVAGLAFWKMARPRPAAGGATTTAPATASGPAATPAAPPAPTSEAASTGPAILRIHGSNTIGAKLMPALAERFLAAQGAQQVHSVAGADPVEQTVVGQLPGDSAPRGIEIAAHGSSTAFADLAAGRCDIGMASRPIEPGEKTKLAALGDMTGRASEHVVGLDGIAVVVNQANPVEGLSSTQLGDIFSGRIADWSQVGGTAGAIGLYARDDKSGTFEIFNKQILRGRALAASARRFEDSSQLSRSVAQDPRGIGFIGLPYVGDCKALKLADAGAVPMRPTVLTVRTEDYLLSRRLLLYTPPVSSNPWVKKFVEFALSDAGQAVVETAGFVGQALNAKTVVVPAEAPAAALPPAYAQATRNAERLPFDFRFKTGSDQLDNKAFRDLGRFVQLMTGQSYSGRAIVLLGFADATGRRPANQALSEGRARSVAGELAAEGLRPAVVQGFGQDLPVASNDTEEGREKNRRVEVWLQR